MKSGRERTVAVTAILVVVVVAGLMVQTILDAQDRGRSALERNQQATVAQIASAMDRRVETIYTTFQGLATRPLTFEVGGRGDRETIQGIQDLVPDSRTGMVLVNHRGVITNGTLLEDRAVVGRPYPGPGIEGVLAGNPAILPAADGLTTRELVVTIGTPTLDAEGRVLGAFLFEAVVAADSDFNVEVAEYRQGETGTFAFLDQEGTVIASSDAGLLGRPLPDPAFAAGDEGFRRQSGKVVANADVPAAGWRVVFFQDESEFEAGLGRRVQNAILLLVVLAFLGAVLAFVGLARRLRAERVERQRMEEINRTREEFISIVSHELRTPVAGVLGFLQTALDHWDTLDDAGRREAVVRACANAQRLHAMTRDVLDTSGLESGQLTYTFEPVDLSGEVEGAVLAARDAAPGRTIRFERPAGPVAVRADADRVQQVLMNLLDNATRHSPPDTAVTVRLEVVDGEARVEVVDAGAGMSEAELDSVFEKFVRGRSRVRGTGLGLFIARQVVEAHGGRIWATSADGAGATFAFAIPLVRAPAPTGRG